MEISGGQNSDPKILKQLENMQRKKYGNYLILVSMNNTHEKILICNNDFFVITSFNWPSFRGDPNLNFVKKQDIIQKSKKEVKK